MPLPFGLPLVPTILGGISAGAGVLSGIASGKERRRRGEILKSFEDILASLQGGGAFGGITTTEGVREKFDLPRISREDISAIFAPGRAQLSTQLGRSRSAQQARMNTRGIGTPEAIFQPIEREFAGAFGQLATAEAEQFLQRRTERERFVANLLAQSMGERDAFALAQNRQKMIVLASMVGLPPGSSFDDILKGITTAVGFGTSFAGIPLGGGQTIASRFLFPGSDLGPGTEVGPQGPA